MMDGRMDEMSKQSFNPYLCSCVDFPIVHNPSFCTARRPVVDNLHVNDLGCMNICRSLCNALCRDDEQVSSLKSASRNSM